MAIKECSFTKDFEELDGSPEERFAYGTTNVGVTRRVKCKWEDRKQLAKEFIGYTEYRGEEIIQHKAHLYQMLNNYVYAKSADPRPFGKQTGGDSDGFATYNYAIITVTYGTLDTEYEQNIAIARQEISKDYGGTVQVTETIAARSEFATISNEELCWYGDAADKLEDLEAPGKINVLWEWTISIRNAWKLPDLHLYAGYVNSNRCYSKSLGKYFPPETLLFGNPTITKRFGANRPFFDIDLQFLYKNNGTFSTPYGWNHFIRPKESYYRLYCERIAHQDSPNQAIDMYPKMDFGAIII